MLVNELDRLRNGEALSVTIKCNNNERIMNMTNIEMDVARSTIRTNNAIADHLQEIDWEQRRYEIAKDYAIGLMMSEWYDGEKEEACKCGVQFADKLIEELKKPQTQK